MESVQASKATASPHFILTAGIKQHHRLGSFQHGRVKGLFRQGKDLLQGQLSLLVPGNRFHHLIILNVCKGPTSVREEKYAHTRHRELHAHLQPH